MFSDLIFEFSIPGFSDEPLDFSSEQSVLIGLGAEVLNVQELFKSVPLLGDVVKEMFPQHVAYFEEHAALRAPELLEVADAWRARLDIWWQAQLSIKTPSLTLTLLLSRLIMWEEQRLLHRRPADKDQIERLLPGGDPSVGCATVTAVVDDIRVHIPGTFAVTRFNESDNASGNFLMFSLEKGLWFDTNPQLAGRELVRQIYEASLWSTSLSEQDREVLKNAEALTLHFEPLEVSPIRYLIDAMHEVQRQAIEAALEGLEEGAVQVGLLDAVARMEGVVSVFKQRTEALVSRYRRRLLPHWRQFLQGEELDQYHALEANVQQTQSRCEAQMAGGSTPHEYASQRIQAYMNDALGEFVDPGEIMLTLRYDYDINVLEQVPAPEHRFSLLDYAMSGGCSNNRLKVEASDPLWREKLPETFLQPMIEALDLRVGFQQHIRSLYENPDMMKSLQETLDARLALAALAARFQGLPAGAYDIVQGVRTGDLHHKGISVAQVYLNEETLLGDMLCFVQGDTLVLYAPGSPAGDFLEFQSLRQLNLEVGSWTITSNGSQYLLAQCMQDKRQDLARYLRKVEIISTDWAQHTVTLVPLEGEDWDQVLARVAQHKVADLLDDLQAVTPNWYLEAEPGQRQRLADLDNQLKVVLADYNTLTAIQPFRTFVHEQVSERINQISGGRGERIDPDTVLVETEPGAVRTLTDTLIKGYPASFNFSAFAKISSSSGQNVSHLDRRVLDGYIRAARLGEKYMARLEETFLDPAAPGFDSQRWLYRKMFALKLQRDWLTEAEQGYLGKAHAVWLGEVAESFSTSQIDDNCQVFELELKGCRIEGAYLMRNPADPEDTLLYLPEQPESLMFQTPSQLARAWRENDLGDYFYRRASIKEQPKIGTLIDDQLHHGDGIDIVLNAIGQGDRIIDMAADFQARIERLVEDVDEDVETVAERISGLVVEWGITAAGILTVPFPPAAMAVGLMCAARSFVRGAMAWQDGDRSTALMYFGVGALATFASSGAAGKVFEKVIRQLSKLNLRFDMPGLFKPSAVVRSAQAKQLLAKLNEGAVDMGGELLPAAYDGFSKEILWLVNHEPVLH